MLKFFAATLLNSSSMDQAGSEADTVQESVCDSMAGSKAIAEATNPKDAPCSK